MGIGSSFKRAVRKITKPVAKVLDKIIPNEIKPALPYLAAVAPFLAPTAGIFGTMAGRAALAGGSNLLAQLAQEGSEGDFSLGSVALASGIGALSTPGAGDSLRGGIAKTTAREAGIMSQGAGSAVTPTGAIGEGFLQSAENIGREALAGSADFLSAQPGSGGVGDILRPGGTKAGLNMATAKAVSSPFSQATIDLAVADARRALKQYERDLADYEAETGEAQFASDEARRTAIRAAMTAGGHSEDIISETFALLGLKDGGVVKMKDGGIMNLRGMEMDLRGGGFVPIGKKERADDVPARLSKNEFVMTADAVRAAGGGDINEGARRMYETMNRLEARA